MFAVCLMGIEMSFFSNYSLLFVFSRVERRALRSEAGRGQRNQLAESSVSSVLLGSGR